MTTALDTLFGSLVHSAETDVQSWLIQQYAALQAMPQRLAALSAVQQAMSAKPGVTADSARAASLADQGAALGRLNAGYPGMIQSVNMAYAAVQSAQTAGATLTTGADVAIAVAQAQGFSSGVDAVQSALKDILDNALASGAITPAEANQLQAGLTSPGAGWLRYLLYAGAGYVAWRLLRRVL